MRLKDLVIGLSLLVSLSLMATLPRGQEAPVPGSLSGPGGPGPSDLVLVHANIVPLDEERVIPDGVIVITAGTISAMGPAGTVTVPEDVRVIDVEGAYVLPGLMDMHVHLGFPGFDSEEAHRHLSLFLRHGVTTVRNMHGMEGHRALRDSIRAGLLTGPTIVTTSPMFPRAFLGSAESARQGVRSFAEVGYDAIKIVRVPPDLLAPLVAQAEELDLPVVGHVPDLAVPFDEVLASGMTSLEHVIEIYLTAFGSRSSFEAIPDVVDRFVSAGVTVSTLLIGEEFVRRAGVDGTAFLESEHARRVSDLLGEAALDGMRDIAAGGMAGMNDERPFDLPFLLAFLDALDAAGGNVVLGTDSRTAATVPGLALHQELGLLVGGGFTPYRALRTATVNAARLLGDDVKKGTLAVGYDADLMVVASNPLESIAGLADVRGIALNGTWLSRPDLDGRVHASSPR